MAQGVEDSDSKRGYRDKDSGSWAGGGGMFVKTGTTLAAVK